MINKDSLDQLLSRVDIVSVIGQYVKLKKQGANYVGLCPFHDEKTPSFNVSPAKNYYKCFGCGRQGDSIDFLQNNQSLSFVEAVKVAASLMNFSLDEDAPKKEYKRPVARLTNISDRFVGYFENERKISNNTLLRFGITESVEWMPKAQKEIPVLCFNYFKSKELVNIKFRGAQKDFKLNKESELIFYNLDAIHGESECVIVEGEIDALTLHECGIYNVVSVPNGAATGTNRLEYLDNCWQYFTDKTKIILFTDNDAPGYNLREELARRLGKNRCRKVSFPEDCKDANNVLIKHGKKAVTDMVATAAEFPIEGVLQTADIIDDIISFYENGYPKGTKAGIEQFDDLISFMGGQFTVVTGIPGSGKSEFVDNIMVHLSKNSEWSFGVCSFENQPSSLHATKLMEKFSGKSFQFRREAEHRMNREEMEFAIYNVDKYYHFININQVDVTLAGILEKAEELVLRKGIKGLLIDPWNYIEHKIPHGYTETQYISESLTALKSFCLKTGVHCFLIAHPTKLQKDKQTKKYEVPTLYSISGSAHFFNKTDNGITIYRDFESGVVDVYVQKIRYSWLGKIGFCSFNFDTFTRQYYGI